MRIGILPYELRYQTDLTKVFIKDLVWPGQPAPNLSTVADLDRNDHVVVYPSSKRILRGFGKIHCKVDLILAEPLAIQKRYYQNIWLLRHKFNAIFCRYGYYAQRYDNVIQIPVVESWVDGHAVNVTLEKIQFCSLIASAKTDLIGHKLRHELVAWINQVDAPVAVLGRGYKSFENKQDGLLPYRYSVVIENVQEPDYFTEKLLDCILCGSLPIYWGAPNIGDYFDVAGMIVCDNLVEIQQAIGLKSRAVTRPTHRQKTAMETNRKIALALSQLPPRIVEAIIKQGS